MRRAIYSLLLLAVVTLVLACGGAGNVPRKSAEHSQPKLPVEPNGTGEVPNEPTRNGPENPADLHPIAWQERKNDTGAFLAIRKFVRAHLFQPHTAEFPGMFADERVSWYENQTYELKSWVEAQNTFGAMIRNDFVCRVQQVNEDDFALIFLSIGGTVFANKPTSVQSTEATNPKLDEGLPSAVAANSDEEAKAARYLTTVKQLVRKKEIERASEHLQRLVTRYPETDAARQARELSESLAPERETPAQVRE